MGRPPFAKFRGMLGAEVFSLCRRSGAAAAKRRITGTAPLRRHLPIAQEVCAAPAWTLPATVASADDCRAAAWHGDVLAHHATSSGAVRLGLARPS